MYMYIYVFYNLVYTIHIHAIYTYIYLYLYDMILKRMFNANDLVFVILARVLLNPAVCIATRRSRNYLKNIYRYIAFAVVKQYRITYIYKRIYCKYIRTTIPSHKALHACLTRNLLSVYIHTTHTHLCYTPRNEHLFFNSFLFWYMRVYIFLQNIPHSDTTPIYKKSSHKPRICVRYSFLLYTYIYHHIYIYKMYIISVYIIYLIKKTVFSVLPPFCFVACGGVRFHFLFL